MMPMEITYSFLGTVDFDVPVSTGRQWYDWVKSSGNSVLSIQGLMCVNNITQSQRTSKKETKGAERAWRNRKQQILRQT